MNHKDLNKLNNNVDNLEWNTYKENIIHSWRNGACTPTGQKGELHHGSKLKEHEVLEIRRLLENKESTLTELSNKYNVTSTNISDIKKRKTWRHI